MKFWPSWRTNRDTRGAFWSAFSLVFLLCRTNAHERATLKCDDVRCWLVAAYKGWPGQTSSQDIHAENTTVGYFSPSRLQFHSCLGKAEATARLRAGLMPASGPPAREGADIETMDGQPVGKVGP